MNVVQPIGRRAWLVWGVGVVAYTVGVLQRTSLGVAGLDVVARFHVSAGILATFAVIQLLVYAAMQVPVGILVDRFGARVMVVGGAALMALGQLSLALAHSVGAALVARVLVGAGDAMTFISVLRLVTSWFPSRRVPLVTQLTGLLGQFGQILSAIPLVALLHGPGWTPAFLSAAAMSVLAGVLALALVRDSPDGKRSREDAPTWHQVRRDLAKAWRHPGTRLGLWTHFTTPFSGTVFAMLWGYPFLISGEGLSRQEASALFTLFVVAAMTAGPVIGELVARHPLRRSWLVLTIIGAVIALWTVVLALPDAAPLWLLVLLVLALAVSGPGSMISFDYARTFNPPHRIGTASGIVNVGGFVAALVAILLVGVVMNVSGHGSTYTLNSFRLAFLVQYPIWAIGVAGFLRSRHTVRARLAKEGVTIPPIRDAIRRNREQRRSSSGTEGE
jgi:sugar phosphate permease